MKITSIPVSQIKIPDDRQRMDPGNIISLALSIHERGLINPIVIEYESGVPVLRAGFRRHTAWSYLLTAYPEWPEEIPCREWQALSPLDREILELEENVHRKQLSWEEEAKGILRIHQIMCGQDETWTQNRTAEHIGLSRAAVTDACSVGDALSSGKTFGSATSVRQAANVIRRKKERDIDTALDTITADLLLGPDTQPETPSVPQVIPEDPTVMDVLNVSFLEWAPTYEGKRFNLLHCDFPYGINHHKSAQGGSQGRQHSYADSEDVYWTLCQCLADHWPRIMLQSSHVVFWLSANRVAETLAFFAKAAPQIEWWRYPLVWHKSNNKGIISDSMRGPRHTYEMALFGTTSDRKIVSPRADSYAAPSLNELHQSEKPQPMLKHFFEMLVDENTRLLDPTCGSGSALRAAEQLGASRVQGLEIDPEHCEIARLALRKERKLRAATSA